MTHTTEQERAEFEAWALINMATYRTPEWMFLKNKSGEYAHFDVNLVWSAWQAARRAPVVQVPQGWKLVPVESTEEMARAFRADDAPYFFAMTTIRCNDFAERYRAALAAAPQPPEAEPVRKPLTEEELLQTLHSLSVEPPKRLPPGWIEFARAIERVHGIT